jgi:predicted DNA-binding protein (MmcQ/YjbR family)
MLYFNLLDSIIKIQLNKKHWNTIFLDGTVPDKEVFTWIDHSYELTTGKR